MTRVNLVPVQELADQHLFAEWRELKMVPAALRRSLRTQSQQSVLSKVPNKYTMNKGHVVFFYNKMLFLHERYLELTAELRQRNFNIADTIPKDIFYKDIPEEFKTKNWSPTPEEIQINIERIVIRLNERPGWYRHHGVSMPTEYFNRLYKK